MATIDYYVSLQSPWTYLGHQRIVDYASRSNSSITIYPLNYGAVFSATGGLPLPKRAPERQAYRLTELVRWSEHLDVPLNIHPKYFPAAEQLASHCLVALREMSQSEENVSSQAPVGFAGSVLKAVWNQERDIAERSVLQELLSDWVGNPDQLIDVAESSAIAERYTSDTEAAIAKGVFGAPSYVVDGELFWGQDRLPFVASKLSIAD